MKRTTIRSGILAIAYFWLALGVAVAQNQPPNQVPASAPLAGATVLDWKGNIHLSLPGQGPSLPVRGEVLPPSTVLETGNGRLLLQLTDGGQVLVGAHARLMVQQPTPADGSYLHLLLGRIRAFIKKRTGGGPPFELGTPSAVIAVRGTQFDVEVNRRGVTEVDVFEGLVEVYGRDGGGSSVFVEPGFSTRVGIGMPPEPPQRTEEMRPEVERPEMKGKEMEMDLEGRLEEEREMEKEVASEISEMMELQEISEQPEVETETKGSSSEPQ